MRKGTKVYANAHVENLSRELHIVYFVGENPALQTQRFRTADSRLTFEVVPFLRYRLDVAEPVLIDNKGPQI